jgi:hypothetical protein
MKVLAGIKMKMKNLLIAMENSLPPPPSKGSRKMLYAIIAIIIIVVAAVAGAFVLTQNGSSNNNTKPSTSPSATQPANTQTPNVSPSSSAAATTTPSGTTTPSPSSSAQPIANFKAGTWVNYTLQTYDAGTLSAVLYEKESVDEDTFNGVACWLLTTAMDQTSDGTTITTITKIWMAKSTLQGIHMRSEYNGIVILDEDLNATNTTEPGTTGKIDPSTIVSYETITVTAGTFINCEKASITTTTPAGTTVSNVWASQNVPIFGLVKMETYLNGQLSSITELTNYSK